MPNKNESDSNKIDAVVLLMVSGLSTGDLETAAVDKLGIDPSDVVDIIEAARRQLKDAADFDQAERLGEAIVRLDDVYRRAVKGQDMRTALAAQKEINRLLGLAGTAPKSKQSQPGKPADARPTTLREILERARINHEDLAT